MLRACEIASGLLPRITGETAVRGLTLVCTLAAVGAAAPAGATILSVRAEGLILVNTDSTGYLASIADGWPTIPLDFTVYYRGRAIMPDFVDGDYLARSYAHKASFGNYSVPFTRSTGLLTQSDQQSAIEYRGGNEDLGLGFLVRLNSNLTSEGSFSDFDGFAEIYARPALSVG
jgi:hypothetical protein